VKSALLEVAFEAGWCGRGDGEDRAPDGHSADRSTLALSTLTCAPEMPGIVWMDVSQSSGTSREA
jgi:hypothetical protein